MDVLAHEQEKYRKAWSIPEYHDFSPGKEMADLFVEISGAKPGETVIDLGCGGGKAGLALQNSYGLKPTFLDFVRVDDLEPFIEQPLWHPIPGEWDYGFCCDVMEHLPVEYTTLAIHNMLQVCGGVFLSVCFEDDSFGEIVGQPLHLTVQPFVWWRDRLASIGHLVEARDLSPNNRLRGGVFYVAC